LDCLIRLRSVPEGITMIICEQKPVEEIKTSLAPYHRIAIVACGGCAAVCQASGTKQVEDLVRVLDDKDIVFSIHVDQPCDQRILSRELKRVSERLKKCDAVLVLACGTGTQLVSAAVNAPCITGLNTLFSGAVIRSGNYAEKCDACGQCTLNVTAGICPRSLCPKNIANGPCSEKLDDKCSVDSESECVWVTVARRAEAFGISLEVAEFTPIDWSTHVAPHKIENAKDRSRKTE